MSCKSNTGNRLPALDLLSRASRPPHSLAEREILAIRLAKLRQRRGVKQTDLSLFSQTAASKLERRKDMKISTLIEYLDDLGMGMEIRVFPKEGNAKEGTLIRT